MKIMKIYRKFYGSQYSIKLFIGKKYDRFTFMVSMQCLRFHHKFYLLFVCVETLHHLSILLKVLCNFFIYWLIDVGSRIGHGLQV